jgi:hypothetical protein
MGKKKHSLLNLLGAGLIGFGALFSGNDAKAQSAETIRFGTKSNSAEGNVIILKHASGSSEGVILGTEDGVENTPSGLEDYFLNSYTFVDNTRLAVDSRPIASQSIFKSFLINP